MRRFVVCVWVLVLSVSTVLGGFVGTGAGRALAAPDAEEQTLIAAKRIVTFLPLQGDRASQLQKAYTKAMETGLRHTVLETDILKNLGDNPTAALSDPAQVKAALQGMRVDAIVVGEFSKIPGKSYQITVTVYDGATGQAVGNYTVDLGSKREIPTKSEEPLRAGLEPLITQTGQALKAYRERPTTLQIKVESSPSGATVSRQPTAGAKAEVLGKTPLAIEHAISQNPPETWTLTLDGYEPSTVSVAFDTPQTYTATLKALPPPPPPPPPPPSHRRTLPLLDVSAGADIGLRSLDTTVEQGTALDASVGAYPIGRLDLVSFPLVAATDNPWLAGLGVALRFGFTRLNSTLPHDPLRAPLPADSACSSSGGTTISCPTTHLDIAAGITWRALLQEDLAAPGGRNADGMALGVTLAYSSFAFDVDSNPIYEGHGYQGMHIGVSFVTPLGLPELRASIEGILLPVFTFGSGDMIANWGLRATSGLGGGADLAISYDYFDGLYAQLGYSLRMFSTEYEGTICDNPACSGVRSGSSASDLYQQFGLRLGYRLE